MKWLTQLWQYWRAATFPLALISLVMATACAGFDAEQALGAAQALRDYECKQPLDVRKAQWESVVHETGARPLDCDDDGQPDF